MNDRYILSKTVTAVADLKMNNETVKNLWHGFTLTCSELTLENGPANTFVIGSCNIPNLPDDKEYALTVTTDGVAVVGKDYNGLMRGYISLLMKFAYNDLEEGYEDIYFPICKENSHYLMSNRMIHICVFPETEWDSLKKIIRLCGVMQYTHIVLEFWGMLQYDALKELAWPMAYSKDLVRDLVREIREFGMEPIPMLNQLGHAAMSRSLIGKHTILDQNPRLQTLFTPDGWAWDIYSPRVRKLLKDMRAELYDLFGPGEYIHIGCDEADYYTMDKKSNSDLVAYMESITKEVVEEGRRPMIWMDMLLEKDKCKDCFGTATADEVLERRARMALETVFVDWQYNVQQTPVESLLDMKDCGHDIMGAPWTTQENYWAVIDTVSENNLFGIMMTTWHILDTQTHHIVGCARALHSALFPWEQNSQNFYVAASLLRRVNFDGYTYEQTGWKKYQIEV